MLTQLSLIKTGHSDYYLLNDPAIGKMPARPIALLYIDDLYNLLDSADVVLAHNLMPGESLRIQVMTEVLP